MSAIPLMRAAVDHLFREGQLLAWGVPATGVLVETLLDRGADGDVAEAEAAIERLAAAPADEGLVIRDIWLLRLRALLARAHGDDAAYRDYRDRYRDMARSLGFEGHMSGPRRCHDSGGVERHRRRHKPSPRHEQTRALQPHQTDGLASYLSDPAPGSGFRLGDHHMIIRIAGSRRGSTRSVPSGPPCQACSVRPTPVRSRPSTIASKRNADSWITKPLLYKHDWVVALP